MIMSNNVTNIIMLRYKEDSDTSELDIVVAKEEEDMDIRMLRSAKVNHDPDSKKN